MKKIKASESILLNLADYDQKGLYLVFEDSSVLELTEGNIERITKQFWENHERLPVDVRRDADFQPCSICPEAGKEAMCYTLRPVLPFLEAIDRFFSFDRVTAVYRGDEDGLLYVSESDMQTALQYISILSLLSYCRVGRKYGTYYHGVIPIMGADSAVKRLYLNVYWIHKGDRERIRRSLEQFKQDVTVICENVIKRLNLICRKDAFVNAFFNLQVAAELLSMDMDEALAKIFRRIEHG